MFQTVKKKQFLRNCVQNYSKKTQLSSKMIDQEPKTM